MSDSGFVLVEGDDNDVIIEQPPDEQVIVQGEPSPSSPSTADPGFVVVGDSAAQVSVAQPNGQVVVQQGGGPQGLTGNPGPPGPPGPIGPPGDPEQIADVYEQNVPASEWVITHDLPFKPQVTVVDSAGTVIEGAIEYVSNTEIRLSFTSPFGGQALLS